MNVMKRLQSNPFVKWLLPVMLLLAMATGAFAQRFTIFPLTNVWRYNTTCLDSTGWEQPGYDDSTWASGPGGFTGGENNAGLLPILNTRTLPAPNAAGRNGAAMYFRTHFTVSSSTNLSLIFSNAIDDAAVFYLNGRPVRKLRMAAEPALCAAFGNIAIGGGDALLWEAFTLDSAALAGILQPGDNVLAVSVHQVNAGSSDMVFGATLSGEIPSSFATTLTGILLDSSDSEGNSYQQDFWNTYANDFVWNIYLTLNTGAEGPFINGPDDASAGPLSVGLTPGTYTFSIFIAPEGTTNLDMNLFFDNENAIPKISVKSFANTNGVFSANTGTNTYPLAPNGFGAAGVPAAGTLSFVNGTNEITLTDFRWYNASYDTADFPIADRVQSFRTGQDGQNDSRGRFTLRVTPYPPTLSIASLTSGTVSLRWPSPATGFALYEKTNLNSGSWTLVSNSPTDDGTNKVITANATAGRYFRLIKP